MSIDVKIGVIQHPHEIDIQVDSDADSLISTIQDAIENDKALVWITDSKNNKVGVPASKIAFVEIRTPDTEKRVGFGA